MYRYIRTCLLLVFIGLAIFIFQKPVVATPENDGEEFEFTVDFVEPDWGDMTANATISSKISSVPFSFLKIPCTVTNFHYFEGILFPGGEVSYDMVPSETIVVNETTLVTYVNQTTTRFKLLGFSWFYPYDSYLLNLTFTFADNGLANENNTSVKMNFPLLGFINWKTETRTTLLHVGDFVQLTSRSTISRFYSPIDPFSLILSVLFMTLGISFLIDPEDLRSRLAIYVAVLFFSVTFFFQIGATAPLRIGLLSLLGSLTLSLSFGASSFLLVSVGEKVAVYDYRILSRIKGILLMETLAVVAAGFALELFFGSYVFISESYFPWIKIPRIDYPIVLFLSSGLLLKYIYFGVKYVKRKEARWRELIAKLKLRLQHKS